jgi:thiol-disulfide isomerase/thioredoxin
MSEPVKKSKHWMFVGVVAIAALLLMAYVVDTRLGGAESKLGGLSRVGTFGASADLSKLSAGKSPSAVTTGNKEALPVLADAMPQFTGITSWLNSDALTPESLKGKVVLIDFWTYSCINCIRTLPYVTSWYEKYKDKGFVVVGVHTPEFAFEKDEKNVRDALKRHGINYPVALDNGYGTWNGYSNQYWPAHYLFDANGKLRETHFGEGAYDETEHDIQLLLAEAGKNADMPLTQVPTSADFSKIGSPETYIGYARQQYFASPERVAKDADRAYTVPAPLRPNMFALDGTWNIQSEKGVLSKPGGAIVYTFNASNANLVMGGGGKTVRAEVTLDGQPVQSGMRGGDLVVDGGKTYVDVSGQRLYSLIDSKGEYGTHILRIEFQGAGVECYAYTFG